MAAVIRMVDPNTTGTSSSVYSVNEKPKQKELDWRKANRAFLSRLHQRVLANRFTVKRCQPKNLYVG